MPPNKIQEDGYKTQMEFVNETRIVQPKTSTSCTSTEKPKHVQRKTATINRRMATVKRIGMIMMK